MLKKLRQLLVAPVFPDDKVRTGLAKHLHTVALLTLAVLVIYGVVLPIVAPQLTARVVYYYHCA